MIWQFLLFISVLSASIAALLRRILLREEKSDPITYVIVFQLFTGALIFLYALLRGFDLPFSSLPLFNVIAMVVMYATGNILVFKSIKLLGASEFEVLFTTSAIWSILAAIIFLQETFSIIQTFGAILIIFSAILATAKGFKFKFAKGEIFAFLAAILFGLAFTNDAFILRGGIDVPSYLTLGFLASGSMLAVIYPKAISKIPKFIKSKEFKKMIVLCILYAVASISIFLSFQIGNNAAQIASINKAQTIIVVLLGIFLLKEKGRMVAKILAVIVAFIGVLLVL